jgi:tryptophan synthase alpha subunit
LALQEGGSDVIELGVPFSDPQADGATIQATNIQALSFGVTIDTCMGMVTEARAKGLTIPVVLFGYYNPFLQYGTCTFFLPSAPLQRCLEPDEGRALRWRIPRLLAVQASSRW